MMGFISQRNDAYYCIENDVLLAKVERNRPGWSGYLADYYHPWSITPVRHITRQFTTLEAAQKFIERNIPVIKGDGWNEWLNYREANWTFPYEGLDLKSDPFWGQFSREQVCSYYQHKFALAVTLFDCFQSAERKVLEIGVRTCYGAEAFCAAGASSYLGIDLDVAQWGGIPGVVVPSFGAFRRRWPDRVTELLVADSHAQRTVDQTTEQGPFALIHIDGDHSYAGALSDLENYSPQLALDGQIVVDGIHWDETVFEAVQAFLAAHNEWRADILSNYGLGDDAILRRSR